MCKCILVFWFSCFLVFLFSCFLVFLFSCFLVFLFSCFLVFLFICFLVPLQSHVHAKYCCSIPAALKAELRNCVDPSDSSRTKPGTSSRGGLIAASRISKECFASVLKKFLFRYLTTEAQQPDVPMKIFLTDTRVAVWPPGSPTEDDLDDLLPDTLLLAHALEVYKLLCA